MLANALKGSSESVMIDIMTSRDLETLRQRKQMAANTTNKSFATSNAGSLQK